MKKNSLDFLDNTTTEELLDKLSLKETIRSGSLINTPNKPVEKKIDLYTPYFFKEQTEEKFFYTPLSPTKCKSLISLNHQRHDTSSITAKKLDFNATSINKKRRKRVGG